MPYTEFPGWIIKIHVQRRFGNKIGRPGGSVRISNPEDAPDRLFSFFQTFKSPHPKLEFDTAIGKRSIEIIAIIQPLVILRFKSTISAKGKFTERFAFPPAP